MPSAWPKSLDERVETATHWTPSTAHSNKPYPYQRNDEATSPPYSSANKDITGATSKSSTQARRNAIAAATVGILIISSDRFRVSRCYSRAEKCSADRFNVSMKYLTPVECEEKEAFIPREPIEYIKRAMNYDIDEFNGGYPHTSYFWQAQMVHYGLLAMKGANECKRALSKAAVNKTLRVPQYIVELEEDLTRVWAEKQVNLKPKTTTQPTWADRQTNVYREGLYQAALTGSSTNDRSTTTSLAFPHHSSVSYRPPTTSHTQPRQSYMNQSIPREGASHKRFSDPPFPVASHAPLPPLEAQFKEWTRTWFAASATNGSISVSEVEQVLAQGKQLERAMRTAITNNHLLPATTKSGLVRYHRELVSNLEYGRLMSSKLALGTGALQNQAPSLLKTIHSYSSKSAPQASWTAPLQRMDTIKHSPDNTVRKLVLKAVVNLIDSGIESLITLGEADFLRQTADKEASSEGLVAEAAVEAEASAGATAQRDINYQSTEVVSNGKAVELMSVVEDAQVNPTPKPLQKSSEGKNAVEPSLERGSVKNDEGVEKGFEEVAPLVPSEESKPVPDVTDKIEEATTMQADSQPTEADSCTEGLVEDQAPPTPSANEAAVRLTGRIVKKGGMARLKATHHVNNATRARRKLEQDSMDPVERKRAKVQAPAPPPGTRRSTRISPQKGS